MKVLVIVGMDVARSNRGPGLCEYAGTGGVL
jgi:hypothetical protein